MHNTGKADIVLSGGKTPEICYQNLASLLNRESALVNQINWFIGDERWVPSDNEQSNNRLIHKNLLNTINAPDDRVYTWHACKKDQFKCADDYNKLLKKHFTKGEGADILLLGIGDDGHTASLFPGAKILLQEGEFDAISPDISQNAIAVYVNKMKTWRLTLTPNFINKAKLIVFLISGERKRESFNKIINGDPIIPAAWISGNKVFYFVTKDTVGNNTMKAPETWPFTISLQN